MARVMAVPCTSPCLWVTAVPCDGRVTGLVAIDVAVAADDAPIKGRRERRECQINSEGGKKGSK